MFYKKQSIELQDAYKESLSIIGNLSQLFSDSQVPYLYYRIAEKIFCDTFHAHDLSRGDIALDASKEGMGIGLKTFLKNNDKTLQKVAEFNKDRVLYENCSDKEVIETIAKLRNERIQFAQNLSRVENALYHCVVRGENRFYLFEEKMDYIDLESMQHIKRNKNSIWFDDDKHEYSFNLSKSTLLKRFVTDKYVEEFDVEIFQNPLEEIKNCFAKVAVTDPCADAVVAMVYLPLYGKEKIVSQKSGLNQWNASGRERHSDEIYIPIPAKIHHLFPSFFPSRDVPFSLHLPDGNILSVKVCQDNSKALMSNPNRALGKWLLRDVLGLKEGELLTYQKLQTIGIDSMKLEKIDSENYRISFASIDSYEEYMSMYDT